MRLMGSVTGNNLKLVERFLKGRRSDGERRCSPPVLVPVPIQLPLDDGDKDIDLKDARKSSFDALSMGIVPSRRDLESWPWLLAVSKTVNPYGGGFDFYSLSMGIVPSRRDLEQWLRLPITSLNWVLRKAV
ncbi:hypothetical protein QYF36_009462 [Acer negundo]|nr:hypothetical protein QYF36_009462 [Acer negundo]